MGPSSDHYLRQKLSRALGDSGYGYGNVWLPHPLCHSQHYGQVEIPILQSKPKSSRPFEACCPLI